MLLDYRSFLTTHQPGKHERDHCGCDYKPDTLVMT
jgi:hypothetical protein